MTRTLLLVLVLALTPVAAPLAETAAPETPLIGAPAPAVGRFSCAPALIASPRANVVSSFFMMDILLCA